MSDLAPLIAPSDFVSRAQNMGIDFDPGDLDKLGLYLALLLDANTRFNLTAITDPAQAWTRHILDSLSLVPYIDALDAKSVIDIGSGGGLPGIPLAIAMPEVHFTLVEATGKKAKFLEDSRHRLCLGNVRIINERAEILGQDHVNFREKFDVVMARAVGRMPVLLELTIPLAKIEGHVLAMKGEKAAEEIAEAKAALHALHSSVIESKPTETGTIVIVQKQRKTPRLYPRKPGEPKRAPLK